MNVPVDIQNDANKLFKGKCFSPFMNEAYVMGRIEERNANSAKPVHALTALKQAFVGNQLRVCTHYTEHVERRIDHGSYPGRDKHEIISYPTVAKHRVFDTMTITDVEVKGNVSSGFDVRLILNGTHYVHHDFNNLQKYPYANKIL